MANISGSGAPGVRTQGSIGDIYTDTTTGIDYKCVQIYSFSETKEHKAEMHYEWMILRVGESGGQSQSWDDLKDKPFYEETKFYTWDGTTEGRDSFEANGTYYKISDDMPSAEILSASYAYQDGIQQFPLYNYHDETCFNDRMAGFLIVCYSTTINFNGTKTVTVPSTGIYYNVGYPTMYIGVNVLKQIDSKYIPDEHINSLIDVKLGVIENGSY